MTLVTANIKDAAGNIYANALVIASFVGLNTTPGAGPYVTGGVPQGQFETIVPGGTDSSGNMSVSITGSDTITPSPSTWRWTVVSNTTPPVSFAVNIAISGASQDISAALQAAAAPLNPATAGLVLLNPAAIQTITQPAGTSLNVNRFEQIRYADQFPGADFSIKVNNAIADLPATGGIVDARGFTGAQTMSQDITIPSGVRLYLGTMQLTTSFAFLMNGSGVNAVTLNGVGYSGDQAGGTEGTSITYTGNTAPIQIGNTTNSAYGVDVGFLKIDVSGAGNSASAISVLPTVGFDFHHLTLQGKTTTVAAGNAQEGITLNGGTAGANATFTGTGVVRSTYMTGFKYGIHSLATDNAVARVNNVLIDTDVSIRTNNVGADTRQGIYMENAGTWYLNSPDIDSPNVALHLGLHSLSNRGIVRPESSATWDILCDVGAAENIFSVMTQDVTTVKISDATTNSNSFSAALDFRWNGQIGVAGYFGGSLAAWAWADALGQWDIRAGHSASQEFDINFRDFNATTIAALGKDSSNIFFIRNGGGLNTFQFDATNTIINPPSAGGTTYLNLSRGTGGVNFNNGALATSSVGKLSTYNSIATAGQGVPPIYGATSQKSESAADTNVLTLTPPAAAGTYRLHFVLSNSAAAAAVLGWTATWTDSNGNAQSPTNLALFQAGAAAPALTFTTSAAGNYYGDAIIDINAAAVNIVVKFTLASGTITGKASATIERLI